MAITHRKGIYTNFNPDKMLAGEIAVVLSGDPSTDNGKAFYMCFEPGVVKQVMTHDDMVAEIKNATADVLVTVYAAEGRALEAAKAAETITSSATEIYNNIKEIYDKFKNTDVSILQTSIDNVNTKADNINTKVDNISPKVDKMQLATTVWVETSGSTTVRTVTISGVTSWNDVLNIPLNIKASLYGTTTASTLNINGLGTKYIYFPNPTSTGVTTAPPPYWIRTGEVYTVVWTGAYLVIQNPQVKRASTTDVGVTLLSSSVSSTSVDTAANSFAVKTVQDAVNKEYYASGLRIICGTKVVVPTSNSAGHVLFTNFKQTYGATASVAVTNGDHEAYSEVVFGTSHNQKSDILYCHLNVTTSSPFRVNYTIFYVV